MKPDPIYVGQNIRKHRKEKGLTMVELGKLIDAPQSAISNWEKGDNLPNVDRLSKLANVFGITVDTLTYGEYDYQIEQLVNECILDFDKPISDEFRSKILNETLVRFFQVSIRNKDKVKRFVNRFLNGEHPYWQAYEIFFKSLNINTDDKEDIALQQLKHAVDNFQFITFSPNDLVTIYFKNQLEGANINDRKSLYNYYLERYNGLEEYSQIIESEKKRNNQDILEDIELELISLKEMLNKMDQYMKD